MPEKRVSNSILVICMWNVGEAEESRWTRQKNRLKAEEPYFLAGENIVGWTEECENKEDQWNVSMASSAGVQQ